MTKIRDSKRNLLYTVLNTTYGANVPTIKNAIRQEAESGANHERTLFQAATVLASRCASFGQAQNIVREWAATFSSR